jgi:universal stress protein F
LYKRILVAVKLDHAPSSADLVRKARAVSDVHGAELIFVTIVLKIYGNLRVLPEDSQPVIERVVTKHGFDPNAVKCLVRTGAPPPCDFVSGRQVQVRPDRLELA